MVTGCGVTKPSNKDGKRKNSAPPGLLAGSSVSGSELFSKTRRCFAGAFVLPKYSPSAEWQAASTAELPARKARRAMLALFIPDPRIDVCVGHIHGDVGQHQSNRAERRQPKDQKVVPIV